MFTKGNQEGAKRKYRGPDPLWIKHQCENIVSKYGLVNFLGEIASGGPLTCKRKIDGKTVVIQLPEPDIKDRMRAIDMLLDRAFGKPTQSHDVEENLGNLLVTLAERLSASRKRANESN